MTVGVTGWAKLDARLKRAFTTKKEKLNTLRSIIVKTGECKIAKWADLEGFFHKLVLAFKCPIRYNDFKSNG